MASMQAPTTLLSLPQEVLSEILSRLPFYDIWFVLRPIGSSKLWKAIMAPHSYPELIINRPSWPFIGPKLRLPRDLVLPGLRRLCIIRPSTILEISLAAVRSLPATLVEIEVTCQNAETFLVEEITPSTPPMRSLCFRNSIDASHWGLINVNMGERFPQLAILCLLGTTYPRMVLEPPCDVSNASLSPLWRNGFEDPDRCCTYRWTPMMAYNFIRELPRETLQVFRCNLLLSLAAEVSSSPNINTSFCRQLPLPPSLTEVYGLDITQYINFEPPINPDEEWSRTSDLDLGHFKRLQAITISALADEGWWNAIPLPSSLTSLTLRCRLMFHSQPPEAVALPPRLLSFTATHRFNLHQIPKGWFPDSLTKLVFPADIPRAWHSQLSSYIPPHVQYLSIGSISSLELSQLPQTIRTLKCEISKSDFDKDLVRHLPPQLTKLRLFSPMDLNHDHWKTTLPSLRTLNFGPDLGDPIGLLSSIPQLTCAELYTTAMIESELSYIPTSIRRLGIGTINLDGSSLHHFPKTDLSLTTAKWDQMLSDTLTKSVQQPIWTLVSHPNKIPKVATIWFSEHLPLYLPPHVTSIDFGDMDISESYLLEAIETNGIQIISLCLKSVSLATGHRYPATMTSLEAKERTLRGIDVPTHVSDPFPQQLRRLALPSLNMSNNLLPLSITHLELRSLLGMDLMREYESLETLIVTEPGNLPLWPPSSLTRFECTGKTDISPTFKAFEFSNLKILKAPNSVLKFAAIPRNLVEVQLESVLDIPRATIALALEHLGHKIEKFDKHSISDLAIFYWLPSLQSLQIRQHSPWNRGMEDLKRIPNHACSIEIDFDQLTVIEQSNADVQAERWCTIAQAPKWRIEPVLNVNFRRWANLKVLKLKSGPLPHYVTAWLPRLLENLDINHTLFTYSSYCNLPKQLLVLSLSGSGLLRPSFAAALPSSIRHLSTYTLKPKAYEKLPRELLTLEFIADEHFPLYVDQLPPSLTALLFRGKWRDFDRLPPTVRASNIDERPLFSKFEAA